MFRFQRRGQQGAVLVFTAIIMVFLVGFVVLAVDVGRLYIVKAEAQTAVDACALAAAYELDGGSDSLTRAKSVGVLVGNNHNVDLQNQPFSFDVSDVVFSEDGANYTATDVKKVKYVRCEHSVNSLSSFFMPALLGAINSNLDFSTVGASAVASLVPAQRACALPITVPPGPSVKPGNAYGYDIGEWLKASIDDKDVTSGQFSWANLTGSANSNQDIMDQLRNSGFCAARIDGEVDLAVDGVRASNFGIWNSRFGIYENPLTPSELPPDRTGKVYVGYEWVAKDKIFTETIAMDSNGNAYASVTNPAYVDFLAVDRPSYAPYTKVGKNGPPANSLILNSNQLASYGTSRRLALIPVNDGAADPSIEGFLCVLLLNPMVGNGKHVKIALEVIGNGGDPKSPCSSAGVPGGESDKGPKVPALVQ